MTQQEVMYTLEQILEDAKAGILATVDKDGKPRMRWMTPTVLRGRPNALFAVTSPEFGKIAQLDAHADVEWMIQTRALDQIVNLKGKINVLDNPAIRSEVMEYLAKRLTVFWRVNTERTDFIVLETVIEEGTVFRPMKGVKETVQFQ
ncbi:pyridoxamine 5'-phosphate oxidase family protein [candidate division KSB3 bacterium]|jgi:pyridoxamine 5'-phosphate oxidase|uniref:Pyridoxamine 5'-phosphate oxidase family protein n=1 Tax=candidate division KSB3 bacterium TaxID=2044937 RepID=A0A9D5JZF7_9BACT|nr:pyridoxamine 5'-phosphate oxidase family protein [candidate division KSB3 bacterium]MBD3326606.1 pyridoxamine 5'-phosphate oxidase family protein [candidate division KSB3 bacterium]